MSKKILSPKMFYRFGFWGVPLLSIGFIVPLIWAKSLPQTDQKFDPPDSYVLEETVKTPALPQPNLSFQDNDSLWDATRTAGLTNPVSGLKSPTVYDRKKPKVDKRELAQVVEQYQDEENDDSIESNKQQQQNRVQTSVKRQEKRATTPQKNVTKRTVSSPPLTPVNYKPPAIEIRVMLQNGADSLTVSTSNAGAIADAKGRILKNISANEGLTVRANGNSLSLGGQEFPSMVWIEPNSDGLVYVGDRWYRGRLLLVSQGSGVLAVNYVDLEQYLYSVVGTEMHPTAPMEALKAQAIASRSYALVHIIRPASDWYHLGATQRWQAYKGIDKEYNTSQKAVNDTAGQILSYKGGVVESLYAATDEIVARAHGGRGMSQTGAYKLADNGYDYLQILGNYYPGVGVARVVTNQ